MAKRSQYLRTDDTSKRIESLRFVCEPEVNPDLSYLGEYSDKPAAVHIDRKVRGDMGRGELRYFNLGAGDAEYIEADYKRYQAYNAEDWQMLFCQAVATVSVKGVMQTVTSGGLGGVESDSGPAYFKELRKTEVGELREILVSMGFTTEEIDAAAAEGEQPE